MTLPVKSGRLDVYQPNAESPHLTIEPPDLQNLTVAKEVQDASGSGSTTITNTDGQYTGEITAGDRLEFVVDLGTIGPSTGTSYGGGTYGRGSYGLIGGETRMWSGLADIPRYVYAGEGTRSLTVEAQPFAFGVMGSLGRKVDNAFSGRTVTDIATTILESEAEELDPSGIQQFDTVYNVEFDGRSLLDAMTELADVVDGVLTANGRTVILKPLGAIPTQWSSTYEDEDFTGGWNVDPVGDDLWNDIRVEGGVANRIGDSQTTQSDYVTVTRENRVTTQVSLPKSRTNQVDVWTRPTGNEENYKVRVQEDIDGSPTDVTDGSKDLVSKTLSQEFITQDGFTTFLLEATNLPDPNPWVIVESEGENGQDVGVDGSGNLTHQSYYYYPIVTQRRNTESVNEYRRREKRFEKETFTSADVASEFAAAQLRRHNAPRKEFSTNADSQRSHSLQPTQMIDMDYPKDDAVGKFILTAREDTYAPDGASNQLETTLRLTEVGTF